MSLLLKLKNCKNILLLLILFYFCSGNIIAESKFNVEVKDFFNTLPYKTCVWKVPINQTFPLNNKSFISAKKIFGRSNSESTNQLLTLTSSIYTNDTSYFYYIPYKEKPIGPLILLTPDNQELYGAETNSPLALSLSDSLDIDSLIINFSSTFTTYRELMEKEKKYKKKLGNKWPIPLGIGLLAMYDIVKYERHWIFFLAEVTLSTSVIINYFYNLIKHKKRVSKLEKITHQLNNWNEK